MPIYEFKCNTCGQVFEELVPMSVTGDALACSHCGAVGARKLISKFAAHGLENGHIAVGRKLTSLDAAAASSASVAKAEAGKPDAPKAESASAESESTKSESSTTESPKVTSVKADSASTGSTTSAAPTAKAATTSTTSGSV